jgi:hypothetical protein
MIKEDEVCRACSTHGEKTNTYRTLVEKPEVKRGRIILKRILEI